jgi:hypothetical protein
VKVKAVPSSWIQSEGRRLDVRPFLFGAVEARERIRRLDAPKQALKELTAGPEGGIFNGPLFSRVWVTDPDHGVPFLGASSMLLADLSHLPLLSRKDAHSPKLRHLEIQPGTTMISCSGTIGRMVYARPDMAGMWTSQDIMKVCTDPARIPPGYLFAFLSSRFGLPMVVGGTYGAVIQHIEPRHIAQLPVPRLGKAVEDSASDLIAHSARLRRAAQEKLKEATDFLFRAASLADISDAAWHSKAPGVGFSEAVGRARSLRALNYSPRVSEILGRLQSVDHTSLGEICASGSLGTGARFKRIDCHPDFGVCLIGQKQAFWSRPIGRWISADRAPHDILAKNESVLVASSGTLGENEVYCRAILATGRWLEYAFSQHFLRVVSGSDDFPGSFLFALLRSNSAFRALRSFSTGSKQQEIHLAFVRDFPVPILTQAHREAIAGQVREARALQDEAEHAEDAAVGSVERAIEGATP